MKNRYPTHRELQAIELEARRLRAEEMARIGRRLVSAVKNLFAVKGLKHA